MMPRRFLVLRHGDSDGPIGVVAEGVQFTDGTVVIRYVSPACARTTQLESVDDVKAIYSKKNGETIIEWMDDETSGLIPNHPDPNFHIICETCWQFTLGHPFKEPVRLKNCRNAVCCLCSTTIGTNILVELDPNMPGLICTLESIIGLSPGGEAA